ncbi:MAG: tetratricopeptide repeat protein [Planctomycetota bacterium]|nr:tetratricopeptide repeat protein [Planctomycetota bacterium]
MNPRARQFFVAAALLYALRGAAAAEGLQVAVFNFQMTSDTPDWIWLEKFLADQVTTDFVAAGQVNTVARDRMQDVAQKVGWIAQKTIFDPTGRGTVQKELKIEYVVTGVCGVKDGRVEITLQIVHVEAAKEVFRKTASGPVGNLVEVQKQLSAEAIGWFQKRPPAQVLPMLTVWTRSLPALKALYEGMNLYDQGRYAEAWLYFRQANRADPAYVEADYWVGKMYYFMDRYEHARRSLEAFVYRDPVHPRVGDAVVELLHTYEARNTPVEELLPLYDGLRRKYPNAEIVNFYSNTQPHDLDFGLMVRSALILSQLGQYERSLQVSFPGYQRGRPDRANGEPIVLAHHMATGKELPAAYTKEFFGKEGLVYLKPQLVQEVLDLWQRKSVIFGRSRDPSEEPLMGDVETGDSRVLLAPAGYSIKSVRAYPYVKGDEAVFTLTMWDYNEARPAVRSRGFVWAKSRPVAEARKDGIGWGGMGPRAWVKPEYMVAVKDPVKGPPVYVGGFRLVVEMEPVNPWGTIDVACATTPLFIVDIDGKLAQPGEGMISPVSVGEHVLTFRPPRADSPFEAVNVNVVVEKGKTTRVVGRLPWKATGPWTAWTAGLVSPYAGGGDFGVEFDGRPSPNMVVDEKGIHFLWARRGDIWHTVSTDGRTFSPPRRIGMPISSGWVEEAPSCFRDESGRYVMVFRSERTSQHGFWHYVTWSRDFENWSAPVRIDIGVVADLVGWDLCQDRTGRYLLTMCRVDPDQSGLVVMASDDLVHWDKLPGPFVDEYSTWDVKLTCRPDGSYRMLTFGPSKDDSIEVTCYEGALPGQWQRKTVIWSSPFNSDHGNLASPGMAAFQAHGRDCVLVTLPKKDNAISTARTLLLTETADGTWSKSRPVSGLIYGHAAAAFHPHWGFVIGFMSPWSSDLRPPDAASGPFIFRGSDLPAAMGTTRPAKPEPLPGNAPKEPEIPVGVLRYRDIPPQASGMETTAFEPAPPNVGGAFECKVTPTTIELK